MEHNGMQLRAMECSSAMATCGVHLHTLAMVCPPPVKPHPMLSFGGLGGGGGIAHHCTLLHACL